jgi:hypothetical protein
MTDERTVLIIEYFEGTEEQDDWSGNDNVAVTGYKELLTKFETLFLLKLFSLAFASSDVLYHILQIKTLGVIFCANKYKNSKNMLSVNEIQGFNLEVFK